MFQIQQRYPVNGIGITKPPGMEYSKKRDTRWIKKSARPPSLVDSLVPINHTLTPIRVMRERCLIDGLT